MYHSCPCPRSEHKIAAPWRFPTRSSGWPFLITASGNDIHASRCFHPNGVPISMKKLGPPVQRPSGDGARESTRLVSNRKNFFQNWLRVNADEDPLRVAYAMEAVMVAPRLQGLFQATANKGGKSGRAVTLSAAHFSKHFTVALLESQLRLTNCNEPCRSRFSLRRVGSAP